MAEVMLWCGQKGYLSFRCNAGTFVSADGSRYVKGLPQGFSDILVLKPMGQACFIETKIRPRKPTKQQLDFLASVKRLGFRAGVAYTLEEAKSIIDGE